MTTRLLDIFKHNLWANMRLLDACSKLTEAQLDARIDGVFGSIRETLLHLVTAEEAYARHHTYTAPVPEPRLLDDTPYPGVDELRRHAMRSGKELEAIAEKADLNQVVLFDNGTYEAEVYIVLIQAINHGADHRSQIATMMTLQGIEPPEMDPWAYNDELRAAL